MADEPLLLSPNDPRVHVVKRVASRLVQALNDESTLSCISFAEPDEAQQYQRRKIVPSARTEAAMLWMPEVSSSEALTALGRIRTALRQSTDLLPLPPMTVLKSSQECPTHKLGHLLPRRPSDQRLRPSLHRDLSLHWPARRRRRRRGPAGSGAST